MRRFLIVDPRGASAILECRVDNTQPIVSGIRTRGVEDGNITGDPNAENRF